MKRTGIIHAELARHVAGLRHTDTFVICDSGLPLAPNTPCVDLGYRYGQATFADVTATVLGEVVVEHSWVSRDVLTVSPHVHQHLVDLGLHGVVGEHERAGERLGELRVALQAPGGAGEHVLDAVGGGVAGDDATAQGRLDVLELTRECGDEQVDLRGEVAVEGAEGDVGLLGDGAHLHGVEAALGGQRHGRIQDPAASIALGGRSQVVMGQGAHGGQDLNLPDVISVEPPPQNVSADPFRGYQPGPA